MLSFSLLPSSFLPAARRAASCLLLLASLAACTAVPAYASTEASQDTAIAALQSAVSALQSKVTSQAATTSDLKKKTASMYVSTDPTRPDHKLNTELTFAGVNLRLHNGLGATNGRPGNPYDTTFPLVNGLGNLIIGYNAPRANDPGFSGTDSHLGSHCLILGDENNYTSYGGIVAGRYNTISGVYAGVSGGYFSAASGDYASVFGGANSLASGSYASACGITNIASGYGSTVSGGTSNTAGGQYASISGGVLNIATGEYSAVSGGGFNTSGGQSSAVSGGQSLTQNASNGWSAGGFHSP